jgi:hypothetical protein
VTGMRSGVRNEVSPSVVGLLVVAAALAIPSDVADARYHRQASQAAHHSAHAEGYSPPSASIVVDGNTGKVLQESNPDAARHPASLTKIMTLYLLFERLDVHKIKLDTPLQVSAKAAGQPPSTLGLKAGQTIAVEDLIKAVITRSANDAAAVHRAQNLDVADWIETKAPRDAGFNQLDDTRNRGLGIISLDKIEVALGFGFAKIRHDTVVDAVGIHDDLTLGRLPEYFGEAHHWHCAR